MSDIERAIAKERASICAALRSWGNNSEDDGAWRMATSAAKYIENGHHQSDYDNVLEKLLEKAKQEGFEEGLRHQRTD